MRLIGLDVGSKTVGVAVSDENQVLASGLLTIAIDEDAENFGMRAIKKLVREYDPEGFVVGMPKNMNNSEGERAEKAKQYGVRLEARFSLPVHYIDERLTTVQAENVLMEGGVRRENRKAVVDKMAATLILQNYLDKKKNEEK